MNNDTEIILTSDDGPVESRPAPYGVYVIEHELALFKMHSIFENFPEWKLGIQQDPLTVIVMYKVNQSPEWYSVILCHTTWREARAFIASILETCTTPVTIIVNLSNVVMFKLPPGTTTH